MKSLRSITVLEGCEAVIAGTSLRGSRHEARPNWLTEHLRFAWPKAVGWKVTLAAFTKRNTYVIRLAEQYTFQPYSFILFAIFPIVKHC